MGEGFRGGGLDREASQGSKGCTIYNSCAILGFESAEVKPLLYLNSRRRKDESLDKKPATWS